MKKRIVSILLVAAMVAGLAAGCGSKKEEKKEDGVTTVTWMTLTMCLTGALRGFDIPFLLTSGGPGNASELMSTYMYKKAFSSNQYGYGSALAVFIIVESILVVYTLRKIFTSKEEKEMKKLEKTRIRERRRVNQ